MRIGDDLRAGSLSEDCGKAGYRSNFAPDQVAQHIINEQHVRTGPMR